MGLWEMIVSVRVVPIFVSYLLFRNNGHEMLL